MADDIAKLGFSVDTKEVKQADKDLDKLAKTSRNLDKANDDLSKSLDKSSKSFRKNSIEATAFSRSNKSASDSASVFEKQIEKSQKAVTSLNNKLDPTSQNMREMEKAQNDLNQAVRLGVISQQQADTALAAYSKQLGTGSKALKALGISGGQARAGLTQLPLQLQDIVVQLEMGVPLTRTLGQQLPQIAGAFGGIAAAVGLGVGALLSFTPLIIDLISETENLNDATDNMADSQKAVKDIIKDLNQQSETRIETLRREGDAALEGAKKAAEAAQLQLEAYKNSFATEDILSGDVQAGLIEDQNEIIAQFEQMQKDINDAIGKIEFEEIEDKVNSLTDNLLPLSGLARKYAEDQKTLNDALRVGAIDANTFNSALSVLEDKYNQASDPLGTMVEQLKEEQDLLKMSKEDREIEAELREKVNSIKEDGLDVSQTAIDQLRDEIELIEELKDANEKAEKAERDRKNEAKKAARELQREYEKAVQSAVDYGAGIFNDFFTGQKTSWKDLADDIEGIMLKTFANIAAQAIIQPIVSPIISGFMGGGAGGFGTLAGAAAGGGAGGGTAGTLMNAASGISLGSAAGSLLSGATWTTGSAGAMGLASNFATSGIGSSLGLSTFGDLTGLTTLTGAGESVVGAVGNLTSPLGAIGGFAGNMLGNAVFGGDRGIGSSIGGTIGAIGGSFFGPLGTAAGAFLGNAVGGLFGGGSSVGPNGNVQLTSRGGRFEVSPFVGADNGFDPTGLKNAAQGVADTFNTLFDRFGFGFAAGQGDVISSGYDFRRIGPDGRTTLGLDTGLGGAATSSDELVERVLSLSGFLFESANEEISKVLKNTNARTIEELVRDLEIGAMFGDLTKEAEEEIGPFAMALEELNAQFESIRDGAERLGFSLDTLSEKQKEATEAIKQGFIDALDEESRNLAGNQYLTEIENINTIYFNRLDEAKAIGIGYNEVLRNNHQLWMQTLESMNPDQIENLINIYGVNPAIEEEINRRLEIERTTEAIQTQTTALSRMRSAIPTLEDFRKSLLIDPNLSPLTPSERLAEARSQFEDAKRRAAIGDIDAIEALPSASRAFLEASLAFNAATDEYNVDFQNVQETLRNTQSVAERQVSILDQQLSAIQTSNNKLDRLIDLAGVAGVSVSSGGSIVSGGGGSVSAVSSFDTRLLTSDRAATVSDLNALYGEFLDRTPDPSGLAAYTGMRLNDVSNAILNSPEYRNKSFDTGGSFVVGGGMGVDQTMMPPAMVTRGEMVNITKKDAMSQGLEVIAKEMRNVNRSINNMAQVQASQGQKIIELQSRTTSSLSRAASGTKAAGGRS